MAPTTGKPQSYVMQQQQALLHPIMSNKDPSIQVKKECILFSQSVMNGWSSASGTPAPQMSHATADGPEPRILSKKRRDLINAEIRELQNLLPLKKSSRERLSYLGILALTNTFIRKATFFKKECIGSGSNPSAGLVSDFANSLSGFLLVFNREGKILFSSDNILDYLGHTVVELASQGDSIYDIVDKEDHEMIRSQLDLQPQMENGDARRLSFFCRMSTSRYMKTQMRSWKNKIVHVTGKYHKPEMSNDWAETTFFAVCEPVESKPVTDVRHHPTPRPTEFKAVHSPDMKFLEVPNNICSFLGYDAEEMVNTSWYQWLFPDDLNQARQQHMKFIKEDGSAFACVVRMIHKNGDLVWFDCTAEKSQDTISNSFVCNYIAIDEDEVPFYRLHHNLLPFPEHYTEVKRHYLAANSSLLASALNTDVGLASPSGMVSPTGRMPQSPGSGMPHMIMTPGMFQDNMDTKSLLRRQLKRKLGHSMDSAMAAGLNPGAYAPGMELFNIPPPNKMMVRRHTTDLLYRSPAPTMYHPSIHPTYHDSIHPSMYMASPMISDPGLVRPDHHYRSDYAAMASRSVDASVTQESYTSPKTIPSPMLRQSNQNNNVCLQQQQKFVENQYQPINSNHSPQHTPTYEPPRLNHAHSPPLLIKSSPVHSPVGCDGMVHSPEQRNFYNDVNNNVIEHNSSCSMSPMSSHGNYSPAHSSYDSPAGNECVTSSPIDNDLTNLITSYESQFEEDQMAVKQASLTNCVVPNGRPRIPQQPHPYSPRQEYHSRSPQKSPINLVHNEAVNYAHKTSPVQGSRSPHHQISTSCAMESKPYQLQYSITPHDPRTGFSTARSGVDWVKKYSHMSAMEMLLSDSESNSSYYG